MKKSIIVLLVLNFIYLNAYATSDGSGNTYIRQNVGIQVRELVDTEEEDRQGGHCRPPFMFLCHILNNVRQRIKKRKYNKKLPETALHVQGSVLMADGNQGNNHLFISDNIGKATWTPVSSLPILRDGATLTNTTLDSTTFTNTNFNNGVIKNSNFTNLNFTNLTVTNDLELTGDLSYVYQPWKLVHFQDFSGAVYSWSDSTVSTCNSNKILGGFTRANNTPLSKDFDLTGIPHTHVRVSFNYYALDTWVSQYGYFILGNTRVWLKQHHYNQPTTNYAIANCGPAHKDTIYSVQVSLDHTANNLHLEFGSNLNNNANDNSFAIDNLSIEVMHKSQTPNLPNILVNSAPPPPPPPPPHTNYVYAPGANCPAHCAALGKTNTPDPQGYTCTSGEAKSVTAIIAKNTGRIAFPWGCWPDRGCTSGDPNYTTSVSVGNKCYRPGQKRDNDGTDLTVACYCT